MLRFVVVCQRAYQGLKRLRSRHPVGKRTSGAKAHCKYGACGMAEAMPLSKNRLFQDPLKPRICGGDGRPKETKAKALGYQPWVTSGATARSLVAIRWLWVVFSGDFAGKSVARMVLATLSFRTRSRFRSRWVAGRRSAGPRGGRRWLRGGVSSFQQLRRWIAGGRAIRR
jgi:hypothetical protein